MTVGLTTQQIDHICYQIGEWYIQWEKKMWVENKPNQHWLGFAKEELKTMICGDEYCDNSDKHKTALELIQEKLTTMNQLTGNASLLLGIAHGGINEIIDSPDEQMRDKLKDLFKKLSTDIYRLFYERLEEDSNLLH